MITRSLLFSSAALAAMTVSAFAADLPTTKGPPVYVPPPPIFTWTGLYIGGQIGYQWGNSFNRASYNAGGAFVSAEPGINSSGVDGGAHIGYNYQIGQFVAGLEGDLNGSSESGSGFNSTGAIRGSGRKPIDGSIRGRIGVAWDRALVYATGGLALADGHRSATNVITGLADSSDTTFVGWTVGGGVEYAIDNNWSIRAEYRYTDYGTNSFFLPNSTGTIPGGPYTVRAHDTDNKVQAGFSYKFDMAPPLAPPVVAKY
jgi:outer membrane immunogenic protein